MKQRNRIFPKRTHSMTELTPELVREKLTDWTPSTKIQELLGLSEMDEAQFKKQLSTLEASGVIERIGAKKGLKFKAVTADGSSSIVEQAPEKTEETKSTHKKPQLTGAVSELPCKISILPPHVHTSEVTNVSLTQLLSFVLSGSSEDTQSLFIERNSHGITVKTHKNEYLLSEVIYDKETFNKLLKLSSIKLP